VVGAGAGASVVVVAGGAVVVGAAVVVVDGAVVEVLTGAARRCTGGCLAGFAGLASALAPAATTCVVPARAVACGMLSRMRIGNAAIVATSATVRRRLSTGCASRAPSFPSGGLA
jgi:hypothetical protein